jgi:hypothetical protein
MSNAAAHLRDAATKHRVPAHEIASGDYRKKADKCYWLASATADARTKAALRALGDDYDARAGG